MKTTMYHERQSRMFCGMHAINNLLQLPKDERYDKYKLDAIADEMYEREKQIYAEMIGDFRLHIPKVKNTHRSKIFFISLGNYSFEVISEALTRKGYRLEMINPTHSVTEWHLDDVCVVGLLVNARTERSCPCFPIFIKGDIHENDGGILTQTGGHWFSIGKVYERTDYGTIDCNDEYRWYNHDSKFKTAQALSNNDELHHFVQTLHQERQLQMWRVCKI